MDCFLLHRLAYRSLNERSHHQRHDVDVKVGDHSLGLFEIDGGDLLVGFKLRMPLLKKRLEFVDFQDFFGWINFRIQIRDQREYAIGCAVRLHGLLVNRE